MAICSGFFTFHPQASATSEPSLVVCGCAQEGLYLWVECGDLVSTGPLTGLRSPRGCLLYTSDAADDYLEV